MKAIGKWRDAEKMAKKGCARLLTHPLIVY